MLSRVADAIYWMQRYRERAEDTSRLLAVNLHLSTDAPVEIGNQWRPMVEATGTEKFFLSKHKKATEQNVVHFLVFDRDNPNSIMNCLQNARENARTVRETIPSEMWDELNTLYLYVQKASLHSKGAGSDYGFLNRIRRQCQLFTGIADTCMSHNEAWLFGRIGSLLEPLKT